MKHLIQFSDFHNYYSGNIFQVPFSEHASIKCAPIIWHIKSMSMVEEIFDLRSSIDIHSLKNAFGSTRNARENIVGGLCQNIITNHIGQASLMNKESEEVRRLLSAEVSVKLISTLGKTLADYNLIKFPEVEFVRKLVKKYGSQRETVFENITVETEYYPNYTIEKQSINPEDFPEEF